MPAMMRRIAIVVFLCLSVTLAVVLMIPPKPSPLGIDEIQEQLDGLAGGGVVTLPDGIIELDRSLSISLSNTTLRGSKNTTIHITDASKISGIRAVNCNNVTIANLTIDGNGYQNPIRFGERAEDGRYVENFGVLLSNVDGFKLEGVTVRNTFTTGILITGCKNGLVRNVMVDHAFGEMDNSESNPNRNPNLAPWLYSDGLGMDSCRNILIEGSTFTRNANGGVSLFTGCRNIVVRDCEILDNGWSGISLDGSNGPNADVTIQGCTIKGSLRWGICAYIEENLTLRGNQIRQNGWNGICLQGGGGHEVVSNIIAENGQRSKGQEFWGRFQEIFPQRKHNLVEPSPYLPYAGILLAGAHAAPTSGNVITRNTIYLGPVQQYAAYFVTGYTDNNLFSSNTIYAPEGREMIYGEPSSTDTIKNNTCVSVIQCPP